MPRTLPTELVRAMTGQEKNIPLVALLRVKHSSISTLQIANYPWDLTGWNGNWKAFPFSVTLLATGDDQVPIITVNVMNVTLDLTKIARQVAGSDTLAKCDLYIRNYNAPAEGGVEYENFDVQNISYDPFSFSFELRLFTTLERRFAKYMFTPSVAEGFF